MPWAAEYGDHRRHHWYGRGVLRLRSRVQGVKTNTARVELLKLAATIFLV